MIDETADEAAERMERRWTPGPWITRTSAEFLQVATQPLGPPICDLGLAPAAHWDRDEADEVTSNARLIAAAPELYEALMAQVGQTMPDGTPCFCAVHRSVTDEHFKWCKQANAALKKARGE